MPHNLKFASALSTQSDASAAAEEVLQSALDQLGAAPHLAFVFVSPHFEEDYDRLARQLHAGLSGARLLGCTGESIVGTGREIEGQPALSLWVAHLSGVSLHAMHLKYEKTPEGGTFTGWSDDLPEPTPAGAAMILLGDPFTFPADVLFARLVEDDNPLPILGGMASAAMRPGENRLFLDGAALKSGAVAVVLHGDVLIESVVSQGCRPIGESMVITKADRNVIEQLGGKPALERLQEVFATLEPQEQQLVQTGLHVGRVINEYQDKFQRGDFLIRNVLGADRESGSIGIGDYVRAGQTVQFHVRDEQSADEDLRQLLSTAAVRGETAGVLLFTCNGRGTRMFSTPHHDAGAIEETLGNVALAGFFAAGEIGPVGGQNFLHGFTASTVLFRGLE